MLLRSLIYKWQGFSVRVFQWRPKLNTCQNRTKKKSRKIALSRPWKKMVHANWAARQNFVFLMVKCCSIQAANNLFHKLVFPKTSDVWEHSPGDEVWESNTAICARKLRCKTWEPVRTVDLELREHHRNWLSEKTLAPTSGLEEPVPLVHLSKPEIFSPLYPFSFFFRETLTQGTATGLLVKFSYFNITNSFSYKED